MKNLYYINVLLLLFICALAFSCKTKEDKPFAQLLERQGPISTTSEWVNTKAAILTLQNDIKKDPENAKNKLLLALAYMQEARVTGEHPYYYPAALDLINEVLESNPSDENLKYEALVAKASVQLSLHHFEDALETGTESLKLNNKSASVYGVLCDAYVELGNYEKAISMADKMTELRPDLRSYSRISYLREIHGDLEGAIEAMTEAVASGYPGTEQTAWARIQLGELHEGKGDLETAEVHYKMALAELPDYAFAIGALGRLEAKRKNYPKSIELLKKASGVIPEFSFLEELAKVYKAQGEKRKAEATTDELLESLEEDQEAGHLIDLELAKIQMDLVGDLDEALELANKEYDKRPDNIDVCKTLAEIYYHRNELKKADFFQKKAVRTGKYRKDFLGLASLTKQVQ